MTDPGPDCGLGEEIGVDELLAGEAADLIEPLCEDVQTWVEHVYAPVYVRKISQTQRWCPSWWAHGEAIIRLTALWRSWEAARVSEEATGMTDWLRTCFDAINPVLLAPDGPFSSCTNDRHSDQAPMPTAPAPPGHWADTD
ncbi:DUF4913 domain-containing protein [Jatrophihabitans lederbergiae]|uniref:DUF4913 domain-containing protein n=1 Tax=Jatrophihabitans lederbergiae TaxID=3075547 RepID=A0ABU2JBY8_9ACTN|nr:DUF4913 domain-containing protein [Jatrophihabitans sp. DSM 44399]MDT0262462.1 DUF4913 domain-containing protein [Jatrophihabitans sp. DSM 44399]